MEIDAISFDADQTLWDFAGMYRKALDATVTAMIDGGHADAGLVSADALKSVRDEVAAASRGRAHSLEDVREQSFALFLQRIGHANPDGAASALVEQYLQVRFDAIQLYPEVQTSLIRIKQRYRIGLLTNGNTYPDRCGLPDTFDAAVFGPEHGFEKPDPRAFALIAEQLQVEVTRLAHVGDSRDDIDGANDVGATSVFINRGGVVPSWAANADHQIDNLTDLETLLG